ncbi:DsbE family thiol:disulfide interchange protein [Hoeflea prorocentri]|uniref:DsbE family thiol:disulfide interchange protein n=1 Tax=Hoeflea prorocentri TaxID=1922333 RepID=A0A9X3UMK7_9HYPH|nr:DsbE family thiol:disulfide interchange protein [Hoeflea prorocentri]MCY6383379.1 DsbE family thiol:disulfide interchange protein [Hoeflea prorocentri]MDA5401179.1 DsbE family thiol:disulfide interchange protein [Hoeflea prorocentri]
MTSSSEQTDTGSQKGRRRFAAFLPLIAFMALVAIFFGQLISGEDVSEVPSVLIGTEAPALDLPALEGLKRSGQTVPALTDAAVDGKLTLVNVWASWCVPCRTEHPLLMALAQDERINIVGINYKDKSENALRFLGELGNPYTAVGVDPNGVAAIDWGVYGIPESFLVDANGTIVYKQIGPFSPDTVRGELLPAVEKALAGL